MMGNCTCWKCGIVFGMPDHFQNKRREDGGTFYCPNGHAATYGETEAEKLRRERDRLKQQMAQKEDEARERLEAEQKERKKVERKLRRVQKGVCPHCTRSFMNLQQHMATKHGPLCEKVALKVVPGGK